MAILVSLLSSSSVLPACVSEYECVQYRWRERQTDVRKHARAHTHTHITCRVNGRMDDHGHDATARRDWHQGI